MTNERRRPVRKTKAGQEQDKIEEILTILLGFGYEVECVDVMPWRGKNSLYKLTLFDDEGERVAVAYTFSDWKALYVLLVCLVLKLRDVARQQRDSAEGRRAEACLTILEEVYKKAPDRCKAAVQHEKAMRRRDDHDR